MLPSGDFRRSFFEIAEEKGPGAAGDFEEAVRFWLSEILRQLIKDFGGSLFERLVDLDAVRASWGKIARRGFAGRDITDLVARLLG